MPSHLAPEPTDLSDRAGRVRFRRALALVLMTLVVPGSAQLVLGNRKVARGAMRVWLVCIVLFVVGGLGVLLNPVILIKLATNTGFLFVMRFGLIALALGWAYLFLDAWRLGEPLSLKRTHRLAVVGTNLVTLGAVMAVLLFGAHLAGTGRSLFQAVGGSGPEKDAVEGRYNVLLAGGDSGAGRMGLRPDSLTVASIDAATGKTVLIGLPRNMSNFPFPDDSVMGKQFPDGWNCDECMLNAVSTYANDHPDLWDSEKHVDDIGMAATVEAVEGITGLEINYWALVNLKGFAKLVDAFGGVELNVRDRIPVGLPYDSFFHYIEPGKKKLNGEDALWFARARHGSDDYSRMARQKCVMGALLEQVDPKRAVLNIGEIADASAKMLSTSIPSSQFDTFTELAMKAKSQKMATVSLVPPAISTGNPDMKKVRRMVSKGIDRSENPGKYKKAKKKSNASPSADPTTGTEEKLTGGSKGSLSDGYEANDSDDLSAAC